jgi:hypothetical protein
MMVILLAQILEDGIERGLIAPTCGASGASTTPRTPVRAARG